MSDNNSKPKGPAPVIVMREERSDVGRYLLRLMPAAFVSVIFHAGLLFVFFLLSQSGEAGPQTEAKHDDTNINAEQPPDEKKEPFTTVDVDPAMQEVDTDINYMVDRIADVSVPGSVNPNEAVGIQDGAKDMPPVSLPAPGGFGGGQGGAIQTNDLKGNSDFNREVGGYGPKGLPLQGTFYGRSGSTKEYALRDGGGTGASEAAVTAGLKWLVRQQMPDGKWMLNSPTLAQNDRGSESNDIAATALGLLPLLAAGKTHKPDKLNPYDKNVDKALKYLIRSQDPKTGYFGVTMYGHGLATIAMCEAYGLTQEPWLRRPAQSGINLIVNSQHEGGGWRYQPKKVAGDLSISGWQIMALKSGQMAGLDVPSVTVRKVKSFLDSCCSPDEGYGYVGPGGSNRMTAVGLLCRQYMENWGPSHPRMIKSIEKYIKTSPPPRQDVYYYYYATQVLHHFGGESWKNWNDKMREYLIKGQEKNQSSPNFGSWAPANDPFGRVGGRLMMTSLNILTLEVYYRYLPLYYRDAGYKTDAAAMKAL